MKKRKKFSEFFEWLDNQNKPFFLLPLVITLLMRALMALGDSGQSWAYYISMCLIILSVLIYYFMEYTAMQSQEVEKIRYINKHMEFQRERIEHFNMIEDTIKRQRHDLRHHNALILAYLKDGNIDKAKEYLQNTQMNIEADDLNTYCDHYSLNLILSVYANRAKASGIKIFAHMNVPKNINIDDQDVTIIFANLLENAYEGCLRLPEETNLNINVYCEYNSNAFRISIKNTCGDSITFDEESMPLSQKEGGGVGTRSVSHIVEKYDGLVNYLVKDGCFIAQVLIRV